MLTLLVAWPPGFVTSKIMPAWRSSLVAKRSASYSRPQRSPTQSSVQAFSQKWVHALRFYIMFELIFQSKNEKRKELNLCKNSINFCARSSLQKNLFSIIISSPEYLSFSSVQYLVTADVRVQPVL
jgi:hypothetical protein